MLRNGIKSSLGGLEVEGRTYLEVVEAIAAADGSTGWCVMIGAEVNGMVGVNLPADVARRMLFQQGRICCPGAAIQDGPANTQRAGDHCRGPGLWGFASACHHSAYLFAFAPLCAAGQPVLRDNAPTMLMPFMGREDLEFHDTWHVSGLRGTGSADFTARAVA